MFRSGLSSTSVLHTYMGVVPREYMFAVHRTPPSLSPLAFQVFTSSGKPYGACWLYASSNGRDKLDL